jgi:carboxymethylenebutenolidase
MNNLFLSVSVVFFTILGFFKPNTPPQYNPTLAAMPMCHTEGTPTDMRDFALDPAFQALHPAPLPIDYEAMGQSVTFAAPDGVEAKGYLIKAKKKSKKWLFVYQEWWGMNDFVKKEADTYYKDLGESVNVLALDMYDGKSTTDPKEAGKFMSETKEARLESIMKGGIAYAGKKAKIANVGWCFGGGLSLKSALSGGKNTVGSVIYYGMPVKDVEKLKTLNCDVLGLFATETRISKEVIEEFAANMKTAGKGLEYKIFNGVHGFANPSNPKHDVELTKEAYGMALGYLKKKLKV